MAAALGIAALVVSYDGGVKTAVAQEAGDVDLDALRKRFREGMTLESKQAWQEALTVFEEVAKKKMSPHVRFHIALCNEHLGRLKTARVGYQEALKLAQAEPENAKEVLDSAPARLADLEQQIPVLVLKVADAGAAELVVDGDNIGLIDKRSELLVDPGPHEISVVEGGRTTPLRKVTVLAGERLEIVVPARATEDVAGPKPDPIGSKPEGPVHSETTPGNKIPSFVVGAVGIAGLVGSGVMIGLRQASISEVRDGCSGTDTGCDPALKDVAERGQQYEYAAWGLGIGGLACVGAATALFFTIGQDKTSAAATGGPSTTTRSNRNVELAFSVGPTGVTLAGAFFGP
ncbi:MAG: hypothetical protein HOW73_35560 [Polyangiaceae bacterium]|nr:hypothetical protein [Polyangiaceae bacterium]